MEKLTIKEAFGGEVAFTNFLATDIPAAERLLETIECTLGDDYKIINQDRTLDNKRPDLVIVNGDGEVEFVIESQDATGWLDSIHASKLTYYMYDKKCYEGILLVEDADEHIKNYVRMLNEQSPFNIYIVGVQVFKSGNKPYVNFFPMLRPSSLAEKKISSKATVDSNDYTALELQKINDKYPDMFTHVTKGYLSLNNVANTRFNIGLEVKKKGGYYVIAYHAGKQDTDAFRKSFNEFLSSKGIEPRFHKTRGFCQLDSEEKAINLITEMKQAFHDKVIQS